MRHGFPESVAAFVAAGAITVVGQQPVNVGAAKTAATASATKAAGSASRTATNLLPGTRANVFTTIQGNAIGPTNAGLPNVPVRLRDARFGRIVQMTTTDKSGLFSFGTVDPGSYVVELLGNDRAILAASQILYVNAGEAVSAVVKLPFRIPPLGGLLGHSTASAATISSVAAASGVLATEVTGEPVSPQR